MYDRRIKVLHIQTRLIAAGADENTLFTVAEVDPTRFESTLLVGSDSEIVDKMRKKGLNIVVEQNLKRDIHPISDIKALWSIVRYLKNSNYDIVHTHTAKAGFIGRLAAKLVGVPIIIHTLHGLSFHEFMSKWQRLLYIHMEKFVGNFTDIFISVGENIKRIAINEGLGDKSKFITIYSGMDLKCFKKKNINEKELRTELGLNKDKILIGTVARLEKRKGTHYFIEVLKKIILTNSDILGVIVGEGSERSNLENQVEELGLYKYVKFTGFREDIAEVMSLFDIICLTSLWEGIPRVLIQGAALGKPLVAFDIDGNSEIIRDELNGFLITPINLNEFSRKVINLVNDQELRNKMSEQSKNIVDDRWDKNKMVTEIEKLYLKLYTRKIIHKLIIK